MVNNFKYIVTNIIFAAIVIVGAFALGHYFGNHTILFCSLLAVYNYVAVKAFYYFFYHDVSRYFLMRNNMFWKKSSSFGDLAGLSTKEILSAFTDDFALHALPASLKLVEPGEKLILETHLLPKDYSQMQKDFEPLLVGIDKTQRPFVNRLILQTIAASAWVLKIMKGICDPFPRLLHKDWHKITFSLPEKQTKPAP